MLSKGHQVSLAELSPVIFSPGYNTVSDWLFSNESKERSIHIPFSLGYVSTTFFHTPGNQGNGLDDKEHGF